MNIYEKLSEIQHELKAPKGQYNSFGKYKYRSCEDILEAVKPICYKNKTTLVLSDDVVMSEDRFYIKATATLYDHESENQVSNSAYARESYEKKGMDESQITGTASSYARKYALNGLFNIDDTKDADTDEYTEQTQGDKKISNTHAQALEKAIKNNNISTDKVNEVLAKFGYKSIMEITTADYMKVCNEFKEAK